MTGLILKGWMLSDYVTLNSVFQEENYQTKCKVAEEMRFQWERTGESWVLFKGDHLMMGTSEWGLQRESCGPCNLMPYICKEGMAFGKTQESLKNQENILAPAGTAVRLPLFSSCPGSLIYQSRWKYLWYWGLIFCRTKANKRPWANHEGIRKKKSRVN